MGESPSRSISWGYRARVPAVRIDIRAHGQIRAQVYFRADSALMKVSSILATTPSHIYAMAFAVVCFNVRLKSFISL